MATLTVRAGDALARLSQQSGLPACMLLRANRLTPETLRPGMRLNLDPGFCARAGPCDRRRENGFACPARSVMTLQPGETLYQLARRTRIPVRLLMLENDLPSPDGARSGMPLAVPAHRHGALVTLSGPTTPKALAERTGVDARELMYINRIPAGAPLLPGQQLLLPSAPAQTHKNGDA